MSGKSQIAETRASTGNTRVLVIDDNPDIHEDYRAALHHPPARRNLSELENLLFRDCPDADPIPSTYELTFALQGEEGVALITESIASGKPFAVVFVDMRMPPGLDGLQTIKRIMEVDEDIQVVLCTAYSDYSWKDIAAAVARRDSLLILKKPFEIEEIAQLANALTAKWQLAQEARDQTIALERLVDARTAELRQAMDALEQDMAQRAATETALRESEGRFSAFFNSVRAGILVIDADSFQIVEANPAAETMIGLPVNEIRGCHCKQFICGATEHDCPVKRGDDSPIQTECLLTAAGGERIEILKSASAFTSGNARFIIESFFDVSALRQAERERKVFKDQVQTLQRMDAIGKLAAGIAHDFNNLLTPIVGFADLLAGDPGVDDEQRELILPIIESANSANSLTQQLLAFSRKQVLHLSVLDLNELLRDFKGMLRRLLTENITLQIHTKAAPACVRADESQIHQVLLNLTINARDAMPEGGVLTIATENVNFEEPPEHILGITSGGSYVALSVSDTGQGIEAGILGSIFEPFFTTKTPSKGTGMGLSTVLGIVEQHHGGIRVTSTVGKGTTVVVYLRLTTDTPESRTAPVAPGVLSGTGHILVVEDHELVRDYVCKVLREHGYKVSAYPSAEAALLADLDANVLLTDVILPGINGKQLSEELKARRGRMSTIFMSGYPDEIIGKHGVLEKGTHFLQKPFSEIDLLQMVRRVCDTARVPG